MENQTVQKKEASEKIEKKIFNLAILKDKLIGEARASF